MPHTPSPTSRLSTHLATSYKHEHCSTYTISCAQSAQSVPHVSGASSPCTALPPVLPPPPSARHAAPGRPAAPGAPGPGACCCWCCARGVWRPRSSSPACAASTTGPTAESLQGRTYGEDSHGHTQRAAYSISQMDKGDGTGANGTQRDAVDRLPACVRQHDSGTLTAWPLSTQGQGSHVPKSSR